MISCLLVIDNFLESLVVDPLQSGISVPLSLLLDPPHCILLYPDDARPLARDHQGEMLSGKSWNIDLEICGWVVNTDE